MVATQSLISCVECKIDLVLYPEVPVSPDTQDNSSIPGSYYRVVDQQLGTDNGSLQSKEHYPVSQEATGHSCFVLQVNNDQMDFLAKVTVQLKKEQSGSVVLGTLVVFVHCIVQHIFCNF